ncbi:MAG: hypothetical protein Q4G34_10970 [Micrococcus sp.]|nr:hypothetical protein [Micrococcus sp.]
MSTQTLAPAATPASEAAEALTSESSLTVTELPAGRGLYGVVADDAALAQLGLSDSAEHALIYLDRTEQDTLDYNARRHFQSGRTDSSQLRRNLAALLWDELELNAAPASPGLRTQYLPLTSDSEETLTRWMREHLRFTVWQPAGESDPIAGVEQEVLASEAPALNLDGVDEPWEHLAEKVDAMRTSGRSATL